MIDLTDRHLVEEIMSRKWHGAAIRLSVDGYVLWLQRGDDESWTFPGGGRWQGDRHSWDTALRELAEEAGICPSYMKSSLWGIDGKFVLFSCTLKLRPRIELEEPDPKYGPKFLRYQWMDERFTPSNVYEPLRPFLVGC